MSQTDRAVRRTSSHLGVDEVLLASASGVEAEGRRRQVVLLTDRRVLVAGSRGGGPDELPAAGSVAEFDPVGGLLTIRKEGRELLVRAVEEDAARRIIGLLERHRSRWPRQAPGPMGHVRIVPA